MWLFSIRAIQLKSKIILKFKPRQITTCDKTFRVYIFFSRIGEENKRHRDKFFQFTKENHTKSAKINLQEN